MNIMLVEDEYLLNKSIVSYLRNEGYEVDSYTDGLKALDALKKNHSIYVLDIDIPEINGVTLLECIRKLYPDKPVIMISATIDIEMIELSYASGCNDYLKKPFNIKELVLKIETLTRTHIKTIKLNDVLSYDPAAHRVMIKDEELTLTSKELKCFDVLVSNRGYVVTHHQIEDSVWGLESDRGHVRQLVNRLRKKLPDGIIENRVGEGYMIR